MESKHDSTTHISQTVELEISQKNYQLHPDPKNIASFINHPKYHDVSCSFLFSIHVEGHRKFFYPNKPTVQITTAIIALYLKA